jgi:superfamily II DNA or RNA helicase
VAGFARRRFGYPAKRGANQAAPAAVGFPFEFDEVDDDLFEALLSSQEESSEQSNGEPADALVSAKQRVDFGLERTPRFELTPRSYQREAIDAWKRHDGRGVIVLPTGAGKTVIALLATAELGLRTLVVVPTIELVHQWHGELAKRLGFPKSDVGMIGGGKRTMRDLTVITYDSASMPSRKLDGFGLLIVDEVHHLPARAYRAISRKVNAPFRLGLSATPERSDGGHHALPDLVGPTVYRKSASELARDEHIAEFTEKRIFVDLTSDERLRYEQLMAEFTFFIATRRAQLGRPDQMFTEMIRRSAYNPSARAALSAHHQARMIALNAEAKLTGVESLLTRHMNDRVIIFCEYNAMVDLLSERLLIPAITHRTPAAERKEILERFRDGRYTKLVTGRVLNEGVDVPDANVAIVVSGSSASREYIQRLGRVLRPKRKRAMLYELITRGTSESRAARKRRPKESPQLELPDLAA